MSTVPIFVYNCSRILAIAIRENEKIKRIKNGNKEQKKSQYADDTSLTMHFCNESINTTFDIFDDLGKSSGLKINYNKTEILRIGSMKSANSRLYTAKEVSWSNDSIRILGIEITVLTMISKNLIFFHLSVKWKTS